MEHLHSVNQIIEKAHEYFKIPESRNFEVYAENLNQHFKRLESCVNALFTD